MFKKSNFYILCIVVSSIFTGYAQNGNKHKIPDSLWSKSYEELEGIYKPMGMDSLAAFPYISAHMAKAKYKNDTLKLVWSYEDMGQISPPAVKTQYADSIIAITKNWVHITYPALGYSMKAGSAYQSNQYKIALDNYIMAYNSAIKSGNVKRQSRYRFSIANLKSRFGNYKEARKIYKELLKDFGDSTKTSLNSPLDYSIFIFNIYSTYLRERKLDSAEFYLKIGLEHSIEIQDTVRYHKFYANQGILVYNKGEYSAAISFLTETLPVRPDRDKCMNYYYRAKSYMALDSMDLAVNDFLMVDSLMPNKKSADPQLADSYKILADYYGNQDNRVQQLKYIDKLIVVDSIIDLEHAYINHKLSKEYDIPEVIRTKEKVIATLNQMNSSFKKYQYLFFSVIGFMGLLLFFAFRRQRELKKRFQTLISESGNTEKGTPPPIENGNALAGVSYDILRDIRKKLGDFEKENGYLSGNITLNSLSKKLGTNTNYLSKVINFDKNKNFSSYINELRISYVIKRLQEDTQFRKYTIKSIAEDIGFNNPESFSTAFKKVTGIYPSYYIKQLEKKDTERIMLRS